MKTMKWTALAAVVLVLLTLVAGWHGALAADPFDR
jgi:hypothetical protein